MSLEPTVIRIYKRVSKGSQSFDAQDGDLQRWAEYKRGEGFEVRWYEDKATGRRMERPGFKRLLKEVRPGDTVCVWRLDRLGRTRAGLVNLLERWDRQGVSLLSLKESWDTGTAAGRLMRDILTSLTAYETELRQERVAAGVAAKGARPRGPSPLKGRRTTVTPEQIEAIRSVYRETKNISKAVRTVGLSRPTVYSVLRELGLTQARH